MSTAYQNAIQRRAALLQEIERLNLFISMHEELSSLNGLPETRGETENVRLPLSVLMTTGNIAAARSAMGGMHHPAGSGLSEWLTTQTPPIRDNPKPEVVVATVKAILAERGHPMTRRQLLEALLQRDVWVRGKDPNKVLGTNLWRAQDEIVSIPGYGYWLRDQDYLRADYIARRDRYRAEWAPVEDDEAERS